MGVSLVGDEEEVVTDLNDYSNVVRVYVDRGEGWADKGKGVFEVCYGEGGCRAEIREEEGEVLLEEMLLDDRYEFSEAGMEWAVDCHGLCVRVVFVSEVYCRIVRGFLGYHFSKKLVFPPGVVSVNTFGEAPTLKSYKRHLCASLPQPIQAYINGLTLLSDDAKHLRKLLQLTPEIAGEVYCGIITLGFIPVYDYILSSSENSEIFVKTLLNRVSDRRAKLEVLSAALEYTQERCKELSVGSTIERILKAGVRVRFLLTDVVPATNTKIAGMLRNFETFLVTSLIEEMSELGGHGVSKLLTDMAHAITAPGYPVEKQLEIVSFMVEKFGLAFKGNDAALHHIITRLGEVRREEPLTAVRMAIMSGENTGFLMDLVDRGEWYVVYHLMGLHDHEGATDERYRHQRTNEVRNAFIRFFYTAQPDLVAAVVASMLDDPLSEPTRGWLSFLSTALRTHQPSSALPLARSLLQGSILDLSEAYLGGSKVHASAFVQMLTVLMHSCPKYVAGSVGLHQKTCELLYTVIDSKDNGILGSSVIGLLSAAAQGGSDYEEMRNVLCVNIVEKLGKECQEDEIVKGLVEAWRHDMQARWESLAKGLSEHYAYPSPSETVNSALLNMATTPALFLSPSSALSPASSLSSKLTSDSPVPSPASPTSSSSSLTFEEEDADGAALWAAADFAQERDVVEQLSRIHSLAVKEKRFLSDNPRKPPNRKALVPIHNFVS
eukprot:TRINITY_DN11556_c0_g1_i1.p1 TRINITY_DN11556_c0_g1~~TRINITY_DN11556_c0_g1_i1.p1  ORF type:complete len:721 (+),score=112.39 TRINITY_DN11556_c0_g1_i1:93-2255(+)